MKKKPFTKEEKDIMNLLLNAHHLYINLEDNKKDMSQWADGIHILQDCLIRRVVRRDYPDTFN